MARPIKETPILFGKDAERFLKKREENKTKKLSPEVKKRMMDNYNRISGNTKKE